LCFVPNWKLLNRRAYNISALVLKYIYETRYRSLNMNQGVQVSTTICYASFIQKIISLHSENVFLVANLVL